MTAYVRSLAARFVRRRQSERELEEELGSHVQLRSDELERSGCTRAEAERRARIEFGSQKRFKEECREALAGNLIDTMIQDVRFSFRTLRKSPAFFVVAVVTLVLGIGATVAAFSVVAVLLRPFAFNDPATLLWIYAERAARFSNAVLLRGRHNGRNVGYARWHESSLTTKLRDCERGGSDKDRIDQNFKSAPLFFL